MGEWLRVLVEASMRPAWFYPFIRVNGLFSGGTVDPAGLPSNPVEDSTRLCADLRAEQK